MGWDHLSGVRFFLARLAMFAVLRASASCVLSCTLLECGVSTSSARRIRASPGQSNDRLRARILRSNSTTGMAVSGSGVEFYRCAIAPNLILQADLTYINNPGNAATVEQAWVFTLRAILEF